MEPIAAGLYAEIAMIEEQHVTHYESLLDPLDSWLKQLVFHEYNEVYLYWSMLPAGDRRADQGDLGAALRHGDRPAAAPPASCCGSSKASSRRRSCRRRCPSAGDVRAEQGVRARGARDAGRPAHRRARLRRLDDLPADHRYFEYQERVNAGGAPSEQVIDATPRRERTATTATRPKAPTRSPSCSRMVDRRPRLRSETWPH